jgi:hypothetical protein
MAGSIASLFADRQETGICWYNARGWVIVFWPKRQAAPFVRHSVQEDWIAWLPENKRLLYQAAVRRWEDAYAMLSVALNEALSLRDQGELIRARENVMMAAALVTHLAGPLMVAYKALETCGRRMAVPPSVAPLNPDYFRTAEARHTAEWNNLLHTILFAGRSRFAHKLRALELTVASLAEAFQDTAEELGCGTHIRPEECWLALDSMHYDLNTCLRETVVLLKSSLRSVPEAGLESLWNELNAPPPKRESASSTGVRAFQSRRAV